MAGAALPFWHRLLPQVNHRWLVVDVGSRWVRLLVVSSQFGLFGVGRRLTLDLESGGWADPTERETFLRQACEDFQGLPVVFVLPQHRCVSQIVEVPAGASPEEARHHIEAEAGKLGGLAESAMQVAWLRLPPVAGRVDPHWVTLAKLPDVRELIEAFSRLLEGGGLTPAGPFVVDVVPSGQALLNAAAWIRSLPDDAVLLEVRADETTVAFRRGGHGVFATSVARGSRHFAEAFAEDLGCQVSEVEQYWGDTERVTGLGPRAQLRREVSEWQRELKQAIHEAREDYPFPEGRPAELPIYFCGGAGVTPALLTLLGSANDLQFAVCDRLERGIEPVYTTALGAAAQALGRTRHRVSLLPAEYQEGQRWQRTRERVQTAFLVLVCVVVGAFAWGTQHNLALIRQKQELLGRSRTALTVARQIVGLNRRLDGEYERIQPVLEREQETVETLQALAAVQRARTNNDFWFVLFADSASYATGTTGPPARTNTPMPAVMTKLPSVSTTVQRKFIAELCTPKEGEPLRQLLSGVVKALQENPMFHADTLPPEQKRYWVDPKVEITNHVHAVFMDVGGSTNEFTNSLPVLPPSAPSAPRPRKSPPATKQASASHATNHARPNPGASKAKPEPAKPKPKAPAAAATHPPAAANDRQHQRRAGRGGNRAGGERRRRPEQ